jgi:triphosphoribosyl-dephospho-CoA synthase
MREANWTIGQMASLACIWEATARKPGNVHRLTDFDDAGLTDFLASAVAIAPAMESARRTGVGAAVLSAVEATRRVTSANTNLGIVLLLAPLAAVDGSETPLRARLERKVLANLNVSDTAAVYQAIRLARPGGLGRVVEQDVLDEPTIGLCEAMTLAAERDLVAKQYRDGFADIFDLGVPTLVAALERGDSLEEAIVICHLRFLATYPDSLIVRKVGGEIAEQARAWAARVLAMGWPDAPEACAELARFDTWLREDGRRRNPGTAADLVTASLFAALRENRIPLPAPWTPVSIPARSFP